MAWFAVDQVIVAAFASTDRSVIPEPVAPASRSVPKVFDELITTGPEIWLPVMDEHELEWEEIGVDQFIYRVPNASLKAYVGRNLNSTIPDEWEYEVRSEDGGLEVAGWSNDLETTKSKARKVAEALSDHFRENADDVQK
jgi:hypothetical protein